MLTWSGSHSTVFHVDRGLKGILQHSPVDPLFLCANVLLPLLAPHLFLSASVLPFSVVIEFDSAIQIFTSAKIYQEQRSLFLCPQLEIKDHDQIYHFVLFEVFTHFSTKFYTYLLVVFVWFNYKSALMVDKQKNDE